ncbi:MAG TPA: 5-oxoprolinase subunit PxpA [Puia sp.]|nr:5-oxoprolinase subunit PxpA [Puia sp.]
MLTVDLNCDMGEGMPTDSAVYPFISSTNIACGGHAGDADTMRRSIELALQYGVAIGAHPSYPDKADFGRTDILESQPGRSDRPFLFSALASALTEQIITLRSICHEMGARLRHVKPHGALYNRAAKDLAVSTVICEAVASVDPALIIYGFSGSRTREAAANAGLRFVNEVFADRTYQPDGSLTPRTEPNALIHDPSSMLEQVLMMVQGHHVRSSAQTLIPITAETICLHGDGDHAVKFATILHGELERNGIKVAVP